MQRLALGRSGEAAAAHGCTARAVGKAWPRAGGAGEGAADASAKYRLFFLRAGVGGHRVAARLRAPSTASRQRMRFRRRCAYTTISFSSPTLALTRMAEI